MSITIGAMPATRLSATADSHVVQPRFEPPVTTKRSIFCVVFLERDFLQCVHRPDGALDHRKQQRPGGVLGIEIAEKRFADQIVFLAIAQQRLIRNLMQKGHGHLRGRGQFAAHRPIVVAGFAARAAAHDEQQHRVLVSDVVGGTKTVSACFQVIPCHTCDVRSMSYVRKSLLLSFLTIFHANASSFAAT